MKKILNYFKIGLINWFADFLPKNLTKKENIPSHLFLGASCFFLLASFVTAYQPLIWFSFTLSLLVGGFTEAVQQRYFGGKSSDRDIRWTSRGALLAACFLPNFIWFLDLSIMIVCLVVAYFMHPISKKKK